MKRHELTDVRDKGGQARMALPLFSWVLWPFCSDHFGARLGTRFGQ